MPKQGKRRKKTRTHVDETKLTSTRKVPQALIVRQGKVGQSVAELAEDWRNVMQPNTAAKLKERRRMSIREYTKYATPLGATHLVMLSQSETAVNARLARLPRGPTVSFRLLRYSLAADVKKLQRRPVDDSVLFRHAPMVLLDGFEGATPELQLASTSLQNMFPPLSLSDVRVADIKRCVLFSYNKADDAIEMRHFAVRATPADASRSIRRVLRDGAPNLGGMRDVSELLEQDGAASESEAEDAASAVTMPGTYSSSVASRSRASLRLSELGPRITLQVTKVVSGVNEGDVLYHRFVHKSPEEAEALRLAAEEGRALKARRRAVQEENVRRKRETAEERAEARRERREARRAELALAAAASRAEGAEEDAEEGAEGADWASEASSVMGESEDGSGSDAEEAGEEAAPRKRARGGRK